MKPGKVFRKFCVGDGHEVILRTPRLDDLDGLLELVNSLIAEKAEIARTETFTREDEAKWLPRMLERLQKDEVFFLVAEIGGKIVASSDIDVMSGDQKHVGVLGIVVKRGFRDLGIGTEMIKTMVNRAEAMRLKIVMLQVFATNKRAIHVYENLGFVQTGVVPMKHFRDGKYIDEVLMVKMLDS